MRANSVTQDISEAYLPNKYNTRVRTHVGIWSHQVRSVKASSHGRLEPSPCMWLRRDRAPGLLCGTWPNAHRRRGRCACAGTQVIGRHFPEASGSSEHSEVDHRHHFRL